MEKKMIRLVLLSVVAMALLSLAAIRAFAASVPFTAVCPQDGDRAQLQSQEWRQSIGGCSAGGTFATYSHTRIVGMQGQTETHTFTLVFCD